MYFSLEPKTKKEDLYDREKELSGLEKEITHGRIVLLTGIRRIGKTSLLNVFLNEQKKSSTIFILSDCRTFTKQEKFFDKNEFTNFLISEIKKTFKDNIFNKALKSISNIKFPWLEIDLKGKENMEIPLAQVLGDLNSVLGKSKKTLIIAIDEAQNMRLDGTGGIEILNLMAHAYDYLTNIKFILTGSEVGVLHDFLRLNDVKSPLFGRYLSEIKVERFSKEKSIDFLVEGLRQVNIPQDLTKIQEAVDTLDGLVGYLTLYGYTVWKNGNYNEALSETLENAQQIIESELKKLFQKSENYKITLLAVAHRMDTFSKIQKYFELHSIEINNRRLTSVLKSLVNYSYLEEQYEDGSKRYVIPDPIIERMLLKLE
jgi:hypothetical protein